MLLKILHRSGPYVAKMLSEHNGLSVEENMKRDEIFIKNLGDAFSFSKEAHDNINTIGLFIRKQLSKDIIKNEKTDENNNPS